MSKRRRGAYRGIFSALIDDPDFQKLTPDARLTLLTARLCTDAGPSAIFRYYPDKLCEQTGLPRSVLTMALAELTAAGWIEEDGAILWVRNGLRYDPYISLANPSQKEGVRSHLKGLPKRPIVLKFCDYYQIDYPFTTLVPGHLDKGTGVGNGNGSREPEREPDSARAGALAPQERSDGRGSKIGATWQAYSEAYIERYGTEPVRNAKINGMLVYLVQRLGAAEAPLVAAYYVRSHFRLYVSAGHAVDLLLRDAEKLRTEWKTGRQTTEAAAREADQRKGRGDRYKGVIEELREEDRHGES